MTGRLVVDVFELARTGGCLEGELALGEMARLGDQLRDPSGSIAFALQGGTDVRGRPAATLRLAGSLPLTCDRCGQPVAVEVDHCATFYLVTDEAALADTPVTADDDPEPLLGSARFDVAQLIEDEAILAVPLSPRHDKCPTDEAGAPSAAPRPPRNPFAALPDLVRKKEH